MAASAAEFAQWLQQEPSHDDQRHARIDTVIESTTLQAIYDLRSEHDFTTIPAAIAATDPVSLLAPLLAARAALEVAEASGEPGVSA